MKFLFTILSFLLFASASGQHSEKENSLNPQINYSDKAIINEISLLTDSLLRISGVPGVGVGIIKDGKVLLNRGFGYRDIDRQLHVDSNTIFAIGSCTKAFTATTIASMVDNGVLSWQKPIKEHLHDFKLFDWYVTQEVTPLDLLTHRIGLPRHDLSWYGSSSTRQELYKRLEFLEPTQSFRTTFQYQNLMYMTAGILIEHLSNQTWEEYTQSTILDRIGMNNTNFSIHDIREHHNVSLPYEIRNGESIPIEYRDIEAVGPAGSINSSITDMLKWVQFNLDQGSYENEEIVTREQFDVLHNGHIIINHSLGNRLQPEYGPHSYGGGWFICEYFNEKIIWHGGGIDGFTALVWLIPDQNIGMVIICNVMSSRLPRVIANVATDRFLELSNKDWAAGIWTKKLDDDDHSRINEENQINTSVKKNHSHLLDQYQGDYFHPGYGTLHCFKNDDKLQIKFNSLDLTLTHTNLDVFEGIDNRNETASFRVQFVNDFEGRIKGLNIPLQSGIEPLHFHKNR